MGIDRPATTHRHAAWTGMRHSMGHKVSDIAFTPAGVNAMSLTLCPIECLIPVHAAWRCVVAGLSMPINRQTGMYIQEEYSEYFG